MRIHIGRYLRVLAVATVTAALSAPVPAHAAARMLGTGSSYVGLAMNQWVADGQRSGLDVAYTATASPAGINQFGNSSVDFAGTEIEISSYGSGGAFNRSYQYIPDVAGATAIMYHVKDSAGNKVDYLHLSPKIIAAIFTRSITNWNDPRISAENLGIKLENKPIQVVFRSGDSGTTALFYDFVQHADTARWAQFKSDYGLPDFRIINLEQYKLHGYGQVLSQGWSGMGSSDQIAQFISNYDGTIGYDEFGYAKAWNVTAAWVRNAAGKWVQPYAVNISAALDSARLRADLSQELSDVYGNPDPKAYPISAYSYVLTPCAPAGDRQTCKAPYYTDAQVDTMAKWLHYMACDGQVKMAQLGYSPLPPVLSQEMVKSVKRMGPSAPDYGTLNSGNCKNPRFTGSLGKGAESPADPFAKIDPAHYGPGGSGGTGNGGDGTGGADGSTPDADGAASSDAALAGRDGGDASALGGSKDWRKTKPVAYFGLGLGSFGAGPALLLVALLVLAPATLAAARRVRRWRSPARH